jgi:hypothetical protein
VEVDVYVPEVVYVAPFTAHVYESQAVAVSEEALLLLMVNTRVEVCVQPLPLVEVVVYVPLAK